MTILGGLFSEFYGIHHQLHDHVSLMVEAAVESGRVRAHCHDTHTRQYLRSKNGL